MTDDEFKRIYNQYMPRLTGYLKKRGCSHEDAEELAHTTLCNASQNIHTLDQVSNFGPWVYKIALNLFNNHVRNSSRLKRSGQEQEFHEDMVGKKENTPTEKLWREEQLSQIAQFLETLPPKMKRCFVMRIFQEMKEAEIAQILGIKPATVRSQVHQARERLKNKFPGWP